MTCHLDWSLLDSTVTEAVREFINTSLADACRQQRLQHPAAAASAAAAAATAKSSSPSPSSPTVKPAASVRVTKIWWGVEPPLLEILEIDQAPVPPEQQQSQQAPNNKHSNSAEDVSSSSSPATNTLQPPGSSTASSNVTAPQTSSGAVAGVATANSDDSLHQTSMLHSREGSVSTMSVGGAGAAAAASAAGSEASGSKRSRKRHQFKNEDASSNNNNSHTKMKPSSSSSCSPSSSTAVQQYPNQDQPRAAPPTSLLEAILGQDGLRMRVHLVQSGAAGFEIAMDVECEIGLGGDCKIAVKLPMLFEVSNFQFDLVLAIVMKSDCISVTVEPDRFGGDGAEALLSFLSLKAKFGSDGAGGDGETYVDREVARGLALRELRAVLALAMTQGIVVPIGDGGNKKKNNDAAERQPCQPSSSGAASSPHLVNGMTSLV